MKEIYILISEVQEKEIKRNVRKKKYSLWRSFSSLPKYQRSKKRRNCSYMWEVSQEVQAYYKGNTNEEERKAKQEQNGWQRSLAITAIHDAGTDPLSKTGHVSLPGHSIGRFFSCSPSSCSSFLFLPFSWITVGIRGRVH